MYKLALNAGHGLNTLGKRCLKSIDNEETREWVLNSRICTKIEEKLGNYIGIEIMRIDDITGQTDISLSDRAKKANSYNADLYLSIHHNAGVNGGTGGGIMVFTYLSVDQKTVELQNRFYNSIISHTGLKGNRANPLGKQDLGECRMTKMPAILIECGFMDSLTDTPIILTESFADKIATACVEVLVSESGAILKNVTDAQPEICEVLKGTENNSVSNILYRVRKNYDDINSQIGAFTVLENAINVAKQGKCNVYELGGKCVWNYEKSNSDNTVNTTESNSENENYDAEKLYIKIINFIKLILKELGL